MTIICPSCDARFRDPPADVPRTRPMQCGKCEHEWFLKPANGHRIKMDSPSLAPEMSDIVDSPTPILTTLPVVVHSDMSEPENEFQPVYVDRVPPAAAKKSFSTARPIMALTCVAAIAGSLIFKDVVMAELPQTVALYKVAGLAPENPNLEIANVVTTKSNKDGISQLIVKGEIQNIADNTVPIPPLKLTMRGESNANLFAWTVSAAKGSLKAGEKSRFTAVAHDFPGHAVNVEVEFVSPAKK